MANQRDNSTPIVRHYIDTRPLVPSSNGNRKSEKPTLPLVDTLPPDIQTAICRFIRVEDRFMSLASALLKFTFIHRTAKLPWSEIQISKTPKPHTRPYWHPPLGWHGEGFEGIEFNVSHQAGIVILAGCQTPNRPDVSQEMGTAVHPDPDQQQRQQIRIGVDVACTKEARRTPDLSTQGKLDDWVDTFEEMFSERERKDMKERPVPDAAYSSHSGSQSPVRQIMDQKARRFYTYWALKEAYIKMVGEGLLAGWLRQLEFINVTSPDPGERLTGEQTSMKVLFKNKDISESVEVELEGFEESFLFVVTTRGIAEQRKELARWTKLDIEKDIRPCAEGVCSCLD